MFRSGTRLVEVDVVVRDKDGLIGNLDKDAFALYDCSSALRNCKGKRQAIQVFREVTEKAAVSAASPAVPRAPTPGLISNRALPTGEPVSSATVVLMDQLNTPYDLKTYERTKVADFLKSITDHNRVALYTLGEDLHILQDFTDDPQKLMDSVSRLDSGNEVAFAQDDGGSGRIGGQQAMALAYWKQQITLDAIKVIARHMQGVPGRKNLIWIGQQPWLASPEVRYALGQANIAVYPVMVRSLQSSGVLNMRGPSRRAPPLYTLQVQTANSRLGESLGGTGFDDAGDALAAVATAENDSKDYYVLGFYPADADLNGDEHQLTVEVSKSLARRPGLTLQYRQVYLASKPETITADTKPGLASLFLSPLDATEIGITAVIEPDPQRAGDRQIRTTVSLGDVQLDRDGDHWTGALQASIRYEAEAEATQPISQKLSLSFTGAQLAAVKAGGLTVTYPLPGDGRARAAHIVVQDLTNGAAGSIRVPLPQQP